MTKSTSQASGKLRARLSLVFCTLTAPFVAFSLAAQQRGPLPPPPAGTQPLTPPPTASAPARPAAAKSDPANLSPEPPALPVEQIIQKVRAPDVEFQKERDNYTHTPQR